MIEPSYDLFYGSEAFEARLGRLFYEAYPNRSQWEWKNPTQYAIAIAIKVSQYLTDKDFKWYDHPIKTPDVVKWDIRKTIAAVLLSDRTWTQYITEWLSSRVNKLVELGIFQKLLEPELSITQKKF